MKSAHYRNAFFQIGLPSFFDCVSYHLRDAKKNKPRGRVSIFWEQVLSVSVVFSVSVGSTMEWQMTC